MFRPDKINEHEDWQTKSTFLDFVAQYYRQNGHGELPPLSQVKGIVSPYVNQGRWIVDCPNRCGGAICVSSKQPYYICPNCGSPENNGWWYRVSFPKNKIVIETLLLKRPLVNKYAETRNWLPSETVEMLKAENATKGDYD